MISERADAVLLTPASEQNLAALRRALRRATGFALYIVVCDGPARAELVRRLRAWSGEDGVPELLFFASGREGEETLERLLVGGEPAPALAGAVIVDGDTLTAAGTPIHSLNAGRDRLGELIAGPLVLIVSPVREVEMSRMAVDLFDIRAATYEVEAVPMPAQAPWYASSGPRAFAQPTRLLTEDDISPTAGPEQLLALERITERPPASALADAWLRVAAAAMSNAVPWSGDVRTNGSPSVTLTPSSKATVLNGISA